MKKFLPIGSVVMLNDSTKRLMITGVKQVQENGTEWDYCGCLFPEGIINSAEFYVFNSDQIDTLFFIGLQDSESLNFLQELNKMSNEEADALPVAAAQPVVPLPAATALGGTRQCPNCGNSVHEGAKFCKGCGAKQ